MSDIATELNSFEYTPIADVDPNFSAVPQDVYTLEVVKAGPKDFEYKKDTKNAKAGDQGRFYKFTLLIVDHDKLAGRRIFPSLFPSDYTLKAFRRIMDATGHRQEPGQSISQWLESFEQVAPRIRFRTLVEEGVDSQNKPENKVNFKEVLPAA